MTETQVHPPAGACAVDADTYPQDDPGEPCMYTSWRRGCAAPDLEPWDCPGCGDPVCDECAAGQHYYDCQGYRAWLGTDE